MSVCREYTASQITPRHPEPSIQFGCNSAQPVRLPAAGCTPDGHRLFRSWPTFRLRHPRVFKIGIRAIHFQKHPLCLVRNICRDASYINKCSQSTLDIDPSIIKKKQGYIHKHRNSLAWQMKAIWISMLDISVL